MDSVQLLADSLHVVAVLLLLVKICITRNCSGISGKSQILFALVYITRYFDVLTVYISEYLTIMKLFFLCASIVTVCLIYGVFRETYDEDRDSFRIELLIVLSLVLAVVVHYEPNTLVTLWTFSIYLEAVAILPQLFFSLKSANVERIVTYYLVARGSYRALYLVNWNYRFYEQSSFYDRIAVICAAVQTVVYVAYFCYLWSFKGRKAGIEKRFKDYGVSVINVETVKEKTIVA